MWPKADRDRVSGPASGGPGGVRDYVDPIVTRLGLDTEQLTEVCGERPSVACRNVLEWTDNAQAAELANWLVDRPLKVVFIVFVAWLANRLARRGIGRAVSRATGDDAQKLVRQMKKHTGGARAGEPDVDRSLRTEMRANTIVQVLGSTSTVIIWSIAAVMILAELGVNIGPLIAGAGIAGVALGFGAQSLVKDFLSGLFMLIEDQFGVGDVVDVGDAVGVVEALSLRTVRIRDVEGTVWHVPNGEIRRVGNKSQQWARALVDIEVAYDTDLERAESIIQEVADEVFHSDEWNQQMLEEPEVWGVETLGADGIAIRLVIKTQPGEQFAVSRELRRRLKDAFDEAGIEIPFPQRTMWIRREEGTSVSEDLDL